MAPSRAGTSVGTADGQQPRPAGTRTLLIVDDEEDVRNVGCRILTGLGYSVRAAAGPEEALDLFRLDRNAFDLVVTDQTMPKMTGLVLVARLRETSPSVKVVLMSGFSQAIQGRGASEIGVDAILAKPFTSRELAAAVSAALGGQAGSPLLTS